MLEGILRHICSRHCHLDVLDALHEEGLHHLYLDKFSAVGDVEEAESRTIASAQL